MAKYIIIVLILLILVVGAFYLANQQESEPSAQNEAIGLLEELKNNSGIDFSEIEEVELKWNIFKDNELETLTFNGYGYMVQNTGRTNHDQVQDYLKSQGFEIDLNNMADGVVGSLAGFKKEFDLCLVIATAMLDENDEPIDFEKLNLEVKGARADHPINVELSRDEQIKNLFAVKYSKKVSAIELTFNQEEDNHVRGMVEFLNEQGPGNAGIFLAAKANNNWQLVFDGNGVISCEQLEAYDFPASMSSDCANSQTIEKSVGDTFLVILQANPTTGYEWQLDFDSDSVKLINREFKPDSDLIGSSGQETFEFQALAVGQTKISFSYLRSWESKNPLEQKVYQIIISDSQLSEPDVFN